MANGGSAAPRPKAVRDYFQVEDEERRSASGCSAAATAWIRARGDLSWYLHGVFG